MYIAYANPVAELHASPVEQLHADAARRDVPDNVVGRLCRPFVAAWLRSVERQTEAAIRQLDHAGLLEDLEASRRI